MKKINFKKGAGFTLIEMLVYVAVLAIVVLAVSSFLLWSIRSNTKAKVMRETIDNVQRAMAIMTYEIKEAKGIYTPTTVINSHPGQLSLEMKKYLPEGEETSYLDFYLCGTRLCLKKESQNPIPLTSERVRVTNLVFNQIATTTPSIQINLEITFEKAARRPEYQAVVNTTSTASLRNY